MSRVSCSSNEILEFFFVLRKKKSQDFHCLDKKPLTWGYLYTYGKFRLQGFEKIYVGRLFSGYLKYLLSWGFWGRG